MVYFIRLSLFSLVLLTPLQAFCSMSDEVDASDPQGWTYVLDPGVGLKSGIFFTPSTTSTESSASGVIGPAGSLRLTVYNGAGTLFSQIDTQASMLLNTPVSVALLLGAGASTGYRFRRLDLRLWAGLSYDGFLNYQSVGGAVARVGMGKKIAPGVDLEAEVSLFYCNQTVTAGSINYELPAVDVSLSFPFDLNSPNRR
jgi:hypothetical protein